MLVVYFVHSWQNNLQKTKAKIALLDINLDAANIVAEEINHSGGIAKAYKN